MTEPATAAPFRPHRYADVTDVEQLKAFTDVLRLRVLAILRKREATNGQVARELGEPQGKILHHVRMLLDVGLIVPTRIEIKGGNVEKYYRAIALDFLLHTHLAEAGGVRESIFSTLTQRVNLEMVRARQEYPEEAIPVFRRAGSLTDERRDQFVSRMLDLLNEFFPRVRQEEEGVSFRFGGFLYRDTDRFFEEDAIEEHADDAEPST